MCSGADYSEVETEVSTPEWVALLERVQNGEREIVPGLLVTEDNEVAWLVRGALIYESDPETGKALFARAARSDKRDIADQAAIYEAKAYEFLGQPEEGRILIREALKRNLNPKLRAHALIVSAGLHIHAPKRALRWLEKVCVDELSLGLAARFHTVRARAYRILGKLDMALVDYAGAVAFYEQAGHVAGVAHAYNNVAWVYRSLKRFAEAHESVDKAITLAANDPFCAVFFDTKAQIFLDEQKFDEAELLASRAVQLVRGTDRRGVLCEHLCTLGKAYAGQENYAPALITFTEAASLAEQLDDTELLFNVTSACKETAQKYVREADVQLAELAMRMTGGSLRTAAMRLGLTHTGVRKLLARSSRKWKPKIPQRSIFNTLK